MKKFHPSVPYIKRHFFNCGQCTITFKNGTTLTGVFTNSPYPIGSDNVTGWYFNYLPDKITKLIYQNEIEEIENAVPSDDLNIPEH